MAARYIRYDRAWRRSVSGLAPSQTKTGYDVRPARFVVAVQLW
jgi:hypothetical protein